MKLFTCNDHIGHWPVPTASIIIAESEQVARVMLNEELAEHGVEAEYSFTLKEVDVTKKQTIVLSSGEY